MAQLILQSKALSQQPLTIISAADASGSALGYALLEQGTDFGNAVWDHQYGGQRGTQGALPSQGTPQNRPATFAIRVTSTSEAAHLTAVAKLMAKVNEMRVNGGRITWQRPRQTGALRQHFDVLTCYAAASDVATNRSQTNFRTIVVINAVCGPYLLGDPMDFLDDFSYDTISAGGGYAHYTADAKALTDWLVSGGKVLPNGVLTTEQRIAHTGYGYRMGDMACILQFLIGNTLTSFKAGVMLRRIDANNYIAAFVDDNGTNSRLQIQTIIGGSVVSSVSVNSANRMVANAQFHLMAWVRGGQVELELWNVYPAFASSSLGGNWSSPNSCTLNIPVRGSDAALLGPTAEGHAGIIWIPQHASARLDDFEVLPYFYPEVGTPGGVGGFADWPLCGSVPGDAPALATINITARANSVSAKHLVSAWSARPKPYNQVGVGGFEDGQSLPWSVAAITGITGAASTINASSGSAKFGVYKAVLTTPATANVGATYKVPRQFARGAVYVALAWVAHSSSTVAVRIALGVNGDLAQGPSSALTTTMSLRSVVWQPTQYSLGPYIAIEQTAATASTIWFDGVQCVQTYPAHLTAATDTTQTTVVVQQVPDEWPAAPFPALIRGASNNGEMVVVTAIDYDTRTLTLLRAQEFTSGVAHAQYDGVYALPQLRSHYEGAGGMAPICVVGAGHAESTDGVADSQAAFSIVGGTISGGGTATYQEGAFYMAPTVIPPDEYAGAAVSVEVWARHILSANITNPTFTTWARPANLKGAIFSLPASFAVEFGNTAVGLVKPTFDKLGRFARTGTLLFNPQKLDTRITLYQGLNQSNGTAWMGLDYFLVCPSRSRVSTVTGKPAADVANIIPNDVTAEDTLTINPDGSCSIAYFQYAGPTTARAAQVSIGGALPELPPGPLHMVTKLSNMVPNAPDSNSTFEAGSVPMTIRIGVTPRYHVARFE